MINRVTENMKFNTITNSLFKVQGQSANLMEKISTQKNINRPSDDPTGAGNILNYTSAMASIEQYQTNITNTQTWLSLTDTNFTSIGKMITQAQDIAASQSSAVASDETMDSNAAILSAMIDDALSLMNAKQGDSYLFGGSKTDVAPFSATPVGKIGDVSAAPVNNFDGTVTSIGTYTGTVNKTYAVKIIDGGTAADLADATYQVSADGGTTWSATQTDLSAPIDFGDGLGVTMTFTPGAGAHNLSANDSYTVNATAAITGNVNAAQTNIFDGTIQSSGTYMGTTDQTYLVKITNTGVLGVATYQYSTDGGTSWNGTDITTALNPGSSALGTDGLTLAFTTGTQDLTANDSFTVNATAAGIGNPTATPVNNFNGTVTSSGTYTGMENKTYALKIITGGTLAAATYQISADGGIIWGSTQSGLSAQTTLGDGIKMTFTAGTKDLAAGDSFTLDAIATSIDAAFAATANTFNGTVASSGTYTGIENKTYAVKITTGGTLAAATYKMSIDGGKTWGTEQTLPPQALQGSKVNTAGGSAITAATVWNKITGANVQDGTTIVITGKKHDGTAVAGTYTINNAVTGTVQELLDKIGTTLGGTASITADGRIEVTDNTTGASQLAMTLTTTNPVNALDFGTIASTTATSITLGDGINMTINDSGSQHLTANDLFTVNAYSAGYYRGNDDQLTVQVGKSNNFVYNIKGSSAFTAANGPIAAASVVGAGAGLTVDDTITLTRGASAGSWSLTSNSQYPNMVITSTSATTVTIDADNDGTNDVTLDLSGKWNANNTASFTITAGASSQVSAVTVHGPGSVDLLKTLNALKSALTAHDMTAVSAQIADLKNIQTQVLQKQTEAGAKASSLDLTSTNHTAFTEQLASMKSGIEDADLAKLITSFQMQQIALQASYNLAAQIGKMTIMTYL